MNKAVQFSLAIALCAISGIGLLFASSVGIPIWMLVVVGGVGLISLLELVLLALFGSNISIWSRNG